MMENKICETVSKDCAVIRDLMPLKTGGLCCEESARLVSAHIAVCPACAQIYRDMTNVTPNAVPLPEASAFRHEMSKKKHRNVWKTALLSALALVLALILIACGSALYNFLIVCSRPVPTDDYKLSLFRAENGQVYARMNYTEDSFNTAWQFDRHDATLYIEPVAGIIRTDLNGPFPNDCELDLIWQDGRLYRFMYKSATETMVYDYDGPYFYGGETCATEYEIVLTDEITEIRDGREDDNRLVWMAGEDIPLDKSVLFNSSAVFRVVETPAPSPALDSDESPALD